jgi:predicted alpha/beta-fold hydrolase
MDGACLRQVLLPWNCDLYTLMELLVHLLLGFAQQFSHGARLVDAHSAAAILRYRVKGNEQVLAGVGYSLGAIVLNNYVASFGKRVALDVSVSISGALDCTFQQFYRRSQRIWQPMIVTHMKDQFLYPKWGNRIFHQIGQKNYQKLMRASDIVVSTIFIVQDCMCKIEATYLTD